MIFIDVYSKLGKTSGFCIHGHAGGGARGEDVICAAISSAAYMTANTITDVLNIPAYVNVSKNGEMILTVQEEYREKCNGILTGFKLHLQELEKQYPKNILLNYTEV